MSEQTKFSLYQLLHKCSDHSHAAICSVISLFVCLYQTQSSDGHYRPTLIYTSFQTLLTYLTQSSFLSVYVPAKHEFSIKNPLFRQINFLMSLNIFHNGHLYFCNFNPLSSHIRLNHNLLSMMLVICANLLGPGAI